MSGRKTMLKKKFTENSQKIHRKFTANFTENSRSFFSHSGTARMTVGGRGRRRGGGEGGEKWEEIGAKRKHVD